LPQVKGEIINIQYWCIDGKYRIYVARLRNRGKMSFSESFQKFKYVKYGFQAPFKKSNLEIYIRCTKVIWLSLMLIPLAVG
jgi:hypothetical protein